MAKKNGVFIDRDHIVDHIRAIGSEEWESFESSNLLPSGDHFRCNICADGQEATLDFYYKADGTTTIRPTGNVNEISTIIKALLEEKFSIKDTGDTKSYSFKHISDEWREGLVRYLSLLEGVETSHDSVTKQPPHETYQFVSRMGDRLTVNLFATGTLTLQGKPAYLYGEAVSFLSNCETVSVDDIVATTNNFHDIDIKADAVRAEMQETMPHTYGKIDDIIFKLLSPSFVLKSIKVPMEDYSCYAFPALRALEGYLKHLFCLKGVTVGDTFYKIFDDGNLSTEVASKIDNVKFQTEVEHIYAYFRANRHVIFHASQVLLSTAILESKTEADAIVHDVIELIETSYENAVD